MFKASFEKRDLIFNFPARTSRGDIKNHTAYLIKIENSALARCGVGEASPLTGLSIDDRDDFEEKLGEICRLVGNFSSEKEILKNIPVEQFPAVYFAFEAAFAEIKSGKEGIYFDNKFSLGESKIPVNGLVWMSDSETMYEEAKKKIEAGFDCIKLKIGALEFEAEVKLIEKLRKEFGKKITLRADANGAFATTEIREVLKTLKKFNFHSVEQPLPVMHWSETADICAENIVPIALDEELIGIFDGESKFRLLEYLMPQYIVLKPTLLGGLAQTISWIKIARSLKINFWLTSALESNIGLNCLAQFTAEILAKESNIIPQGLGTGGLYVNNFPSNLQLEKGELSFK
jgi:o-succinylbenzoate synthase